MIEFKTVKDISAHDLNSLFESIGWGSRVKEKWKGVLAASSFVVSAWDGDLLVGMGRILEDGVMCMFYDIGVRPNYQNQKIGRKLMDLLIEQVKDKSYVSIGLFVWEENKDASEFYEKFGFEKVETGMELVKYMERE
ncbi:MAG TPA: GNAT family N-acetyltransferase [Patescibacteria group bacterium]